MARSKHRRYGEWDNTPKKELMKELICRLWKNDTTVRPIIHTRCNVTGNSFLSIVCTQARVMFLSLKHTSLVILVQTLVLRDCEYISRPYHVVTSSLKRMREFIIIYSTTFIVHSSVSCCECYVSCMGSLGDGAFATFAEITDSLHRSSDLAKTRFLCGE